MSRPRLVLGGFLILVVGGFVLWLQAGLVYAIGSLAYGGYGLQNNLVGAADGVQSGDYETARERYEAARACHRSARSVGRRRPGRPHGTHPRHRRRGRELAPGGVGRPRHHREHRRAAVPLRRPVRQRRRREHLHRRGHRPRASRGPARAGHGHQRLPRRRRGRPHRHPGGDDPVRGPRPGARQGPVGDGARAGRGGLPGEHRSRAAGRPRRQRRAPVPRGDRQPGGDARRGRRPADPGARRVQRGPHLDPHQGTDEHAAVPAAERTGVLVGPGRQPVLPRQPAHGALRRHQHAPEHALLGPGDGRCLDGRRLPGRRRRHHPGPHRDRGGARPDGCRGVPRLRDRRRRAAGADPADRCVPGVRPGGRHRAPAGQPGPAQRPARPPAVRRRPRLGRPGHRQHGARPARADLDAQPRAAAARHRQRSRRHRRRPGHGRLVRGLHAERQPEQGRRVPAAQRARDGAGRGGWLGPGDAADDRHQRDAAGAARGPARARRLRDVLAEGGVPPLRPRHGGELQRVVPVGVRGAAVQEPPAARRGMGR